MSAPGTNTPVASTVSLKPVQGQSAKGVSSEAPVGPSQDLAPGLAPGPESKRADRPPLPPEEPAEGLEGQVVDGRYRLERPLAQGGMGSVWLANQVNLNRQVAIKLMDNPDPELVERFRREAVALSDVSHPAIVEIHDFSVLKTPDGERGCLVMAFIDGKDLGDYLDEQPHKRLDPREVRILMLPVVSALVELHANGIIHRDIKPDNIVRFVRADGRPGVKLVDFGIARRQVDAGMTASGYVLGTPPYLPPETMLGERHTPLSDIYALGATMFELLTGAPPYGNDSSGQIIQRALSQDPVFPPELQSTAMGALLEQMLSKVPSRRPDAMQVLQALEAMRDPLAPVSEAAPAAPEATAPDAGASSDRPTRPLAPVVSRPASLTVPPSHAPPVAPAALPAALAPSRPNRAQTTSTGEVLPTNGRGAPALLPAPGAPDAAARLRVYLVAAALLGGGLGTLITYLALR